MQITCKKCERGIKIADEKFSKDKPFSIHCPGCGDKIRVENHLQSAPLNPPNTGEVEVAQQRRAGEKNYKAPKKVDEDFALDGDTNTLTPPELSGNGDEIFLNEEFGYPPEIAFSPDFGDEAGELVIYDENVHLALVLDDQEKDTWRQVLEAKNYKVQCCNSPEQAILRLRLTHFHLVVLRETFGDLRLEDNPVYQYILELPVSTRRNIFVVLTGLKFKTLNNLEAFARSVNVVINDNDVGKLDQILKKSINSNDAFYKVFRETLRAMGKV